MTDPVINNLNGQIAALNMVLASIISGLDQATATRIGAALSRAQLSTMLEDDPEESNPDSDPIRDGILEAYSALLKTRASRSG